MLISSLSRVERSADEDGKNAEVEEEEAEDDDDDDKKDVADVVAGLVPVGRVESSG